MNINLYKKSFVLSALLFVSVFFNNVYAQWQMVKFQDAAYAGYITKGGNLLLSDYTFDGTGGIYISADAGETWTKTDAEDHAYNKFYAFGDYIFAIGSNAAVARTADEGKTWQMVSYADAAKEVLDEGAVEYTVAYAMTEYDGKLFLGDFNGAGIMYSEDYGETWKRTDIESLSYTVEDEKGSQTYVENIYQLVSYKGKLYAFGVLYVFEYNDAGNNWVVMRDDSNFMSQSTIFNGNLYCGRSCPNDEPDAPFLEMTSDFETWTMIKGPQEIISKNVRVLYSDDKFIYAATQDRGAFVYDINTGKWYSLCDGYPELYPGDEYLKGLYHAPTQMFSDDEYLYIVLYDFPGSPSGASGLYRFAKDEITARTPIAEVSADADFLIQDGSIIFPSAGKMEVSVYDISGKKVMGGECRGRLFIGSLNKGVYLFRAVSGDREITGRFAI